MKKKNIAIMMNLLIILIEVIGLLVSIINYKKLLIEYYTVDSNIIALIASILFLIDSHRYKRKISSITKIAKYTSCVSLLLTMLVSIFVLFPMDKFKTNILLEGPMPIFHIICPILVVISFVKFENYRFDNNDKYQTLIFTYAYGILLLVLNIMGLIVGPYPFLQVKHNTIIMPVISLTILFVFTYFISLYLRKIKQKH